MVGPGLFSQICSVPNRCGSESEHSPLEFIRLSELRSAQDLSRGLSFPSISASGSNAAVIHYLGGGKVQVELGCSNSTIEECQLLLL